MAKHMHTGKIGEWLALNYMHRKGYVIQFRNWRSGHWEIDLVARKVDVIHFIEVKTKTRDDFGYPEQAVTLSKFNFLLKCAEVFLLKYPHWQKIQFDVLSITLEPAISIFLLEDIYL